MSDLTTSEINEVDASNDLISEMKSNKNLNNCDETGESDVKLTQCPEEKICDIDENDTGKLVENGHSESVVDVPSNDEKNEKENSDDQTDEVGLMEDSSVDPVSNATNTNGDDQHNSPIDDDDDSVNDTKNDISDEVSSMEIDTEPNIPLNEESEIVEKEDDKIKDETISDKLSSEFSEDSTSSSEIKQSSDLVSENGDETTNDESLESSIPSLTTTSEDKQTEDEPTPSSCVKDDDEEDHLSNENVDSMESEEVLPISFVKKLDEKDESSDSKMEVDSNDHEEVSISKVVETQLSKSPPPPSSLTITNNVVTEVVVGDKDEVTLDLSKSVINGVKDSSSNARQPLTENFTNTKKQNKREQPMTTPCAPEDLTLPTKRRAFANGDLNGSVSNDDDASIEEDLKMPPTPPRDDTDDFEEHIQKLKLIRRLKQELLNEEMKLVLLKKIRQSQLKENISQQQNNAVQNNSTENSKNLTPSAVPAAPASTPSSTINLGDLNFFASYQASLAQAGINSALNFSNTQNTPKMSSSNLVNNNVAHSNKAQSIYNSKNSYHNLNHAHQTPMQAHMPKTSIHMPHSKSNSGMNSPFTSSLGRSPYNHLNSHLSAPPPSIHGANSSKRHSAASFDAHNLNAAHSSHRTSSTSHNSSSHSRSSILTPPSVAHGYQQEVRQPSSSSKHNHNQHISQSASPKPVLHNQVSESIRDPLLAQRQAANVKQVLRKQLEKMPQPKIPPPEMHFIPNPSNPEFICYLGLENVVDYLTGNNQTRQPPEPFECVQCGTDFTPVWKWQDRSDPSRPSVICEKCVSKNMKKLVADEHNKRISTFSKAYEELEKQLATASASVGTITPPTTAKSPSLGPSGPSNSSGQHSSNNNNLSSSLLNSSAAHSLFGSGNANAAAMAAVVAAASNFGSLGSGLAGLQHQQVHSNSQLSSAQQVAAMAASFLPQSSNTGTSGHSMSSIPPAAHSSSSRSTSSSNFSANLANAFAASNASQSANSTAQSNAAALALLQQFPKANSNQSLLLAQQLQAFSALTGASSNANNAAMQQMLGFPNFLYSSLLAASFANQNKSSNSSSSNSSSINAATAAAAAAGFQRQFLMEMASNVGNGNHSRSGGHSSNSGSSSMQHNNWKS